MRKITEIFHVGVAVVESSKGFSFGLLDTRLAVHGERRGRVEGEGGKNVIAFSRRGERELAPRRAASTKIKGVERGGEGGEKGGTRVGSARM